MNNILIIEDEEKVAGVIKAYLEKEGYKVYLAASGLDELKLFYSNKFSLVIYLQRINNLHKHVIKLAQTCNNWNL